MRVLAGAGAGWWEMERQRRGGVEARGSYAREKRPANGPNIQTMAPRNHRHITEQMKFTPWRKMP